MQQDGEQQVGAAVLGGCGEHLSCLKSGRFIPFRLVAGFRVHAAQCGADHSAEGADPDVLAGDDEQPAPGRARIVPIKGPDGAPCGQGVAAPDRLLQRAGRQPSVAGQRLDGVEKRR